MGNTDNKEELNIEETKGKKKKQKEPYTLIDKIFLVAGIAIIISIVALMIALMLKFNVTPKSIVENISGKNRTNIAETIDRTVVDKTPTLEEVLKSGEAKAVKVTIINKNNQGLAEGTEKEKYKMTFSLDEESSQKVTKTIEFNVSEEDFKKYNINDEVIIVAKDVNVNGVESMQYYGILEAVKMQASETKEASTAATKETPANKNETKASTESKETTAELKEGILNLSDTPYTAE